MNDTREAAVAKKEENIDNACANLRDVIDTARKLTSEIVASLEADRPQIPTEEKTKECYPPTIIGVIGELADSLYQNNAQLERLLDRIRKTVGEVKILD